MNPNDQIEALNDQIPRKRGRPAGDPAKRRDCAVVTNLTADEKARAQAKAKDSGMSLGEFVRALILPLIGAAAILFAAGCGAAGISGVAGVIAAAKPILDVSCHVVSTTCDAIEAACSYAGSGPSSGGESSSADAGAAPDAGL